VTFSGGEFVLLGGQGTIYYIPGTNTICLGLSGGIGTPGKSGNGGTMTSFGGTNIQNIVQGLSFAFSWQLTYNWGGQVNYSPGNGWASGPTVGVPGASLTLGLASCQGPTWSVPNDHHHTHFGDLQ
jgi:hypothetical protein